MRLLVVALEASANLHLEPILKELGEVELSGIFDPKFGTPYLPSSEFSAMGFVDIIPKILKAKRAINELVKMSFGVDKILLIDSPAFNLPFAKAVKRANPNANITYYILPQVWAWKAKRVAKVEAYCDNIASILPFEKSWYKTSVYVGHPLLDEIKDVKNEYEQSQKIAFLAGSRVKEIKRLMPIFKEVAKRIDKTPVVAIPSFFDKNKIDEVYGDLSGFEISYDSQKALKEADFAFICSGTATLESAIIGTPFVLAYKANWLDFKIAKTFVKLQYVGLANVILNFLNQPPLHVEIGRAHV